MTYKQSGLSMKNTLNLNGLISLFLDMLRDCKKCLDYSSEIEFNRFSRRLRGEPKMVLKYTVLLHKCDKRRHWRACRIMSACLNAISFLAGKTFGIHYDNTPMQYHRVQSLPRKRGRNSGLGVFSRRIAVVFDSFAAILKKIFVGEFRKSFFKNKKSLCASVKTSSSGSTHISLITECFADA